MLAATLWKTSNDAARGPNRWLSSASRHVLGGQLTNVLELPSKSLVKMKSAERVAFRRLVLTPFLVPRDLDRMECELQR